ncbi:CopD family protein [Paenibacillus piri]|uniref:Copper resistance protein D domain-containing protein n=1 Tax=Paenibacillus piri TaxID=2547395 RepID=A0A4R5K8G5_9BACL|nr:CopD family protein [Paenibacillus piri]TDF88139.1 hypothetical protein E1757_35370 [Paenibacillus piri]
MASSVWIGGLVAVIVMVPKDNPLTWMKEAGRLFSKWALFSLIIIAATGILMSVNYVPSFTFESLISSFWGQFLLVKVLLFVVIIFIGLWQRKALIDLSETAAAAFRNNLKKEFWIAAVILLIAGFLVDLSPKEAVRSIDPVEQSKENITVRVEASPIKPGANDCYYSFE